MLGDVGDGQLERRFHDARPRPRINPTNIAFCNRGNSDRLIPAIPLTATPPTRASLDRRTTSKKSLLLHRFGHNSFLTLMAVLPTAYQLRGRLLQR